MNNFWENYWWIVILAIIIIIILFFLWRWYQIFHIDYKWEKRRHFPQWSKEGIITRDNYLLHTEFNFNSESKYIIVGIHGMGTSKEDFDKVNKLLKAAQISFLSFDQRGWGENNRWKYHSLGTTINDIGDVISVINERLPNQKIILWGESLGAALIPLAAKKYGDKIAGMVLTNFVTKKSIFKLNFKLVLKTVVGFIFHKNINMPIKFPYQELSSNHDYIKYSHDRALRSMPFTVLYALQAQKISKQVVKNVNKSMIPGLIIHSGEDEYADWNVIKNNEKKSREKITYKFYSQGKHSLINEENITQVLKDVRAWIDNIIK